MILKNNFMKDFEKTGFKNFGRIIDKKKMLRITKKNKKIKKTE